MSWRDNLLDASFKGAPFKVERSTVRLGRRVKLNEYANGDIPYWEDLGKKAFVFEIEGYIVQNLNNDFDYFDERDALIEALDSEDVGILIHPYYGYRIAGVYEEATLSETFKEGGKATFNMTFVEVDEVQQSQVQPVVENDDKKLIDIAVEAADIAISDNFFDRFKAARAASSNLADKIKDSFKRVQTAINKVRGGISSAIAQATGVISGILSGIDSIIDAPCDLVGDMLTMGSQFSNLCGMGEEILEGGVLGGCSGLFKGEVTTLDGDIIPQELGISCILGILDAVDNISTVADSGFIPSSQQNNIIASDDATIYALLSNGCRIGARVDFLDKETLIDYTDLIAAAIEAFLLRLGGQFDTSGYGYVDGNPIDNTALYNSVEAVRNTFVQVMYARGSDLNKIVEYPVGVGVKSTLELAYEKYEDISRDEEILNLNDGVFNHPGFMPNGGTVRILNE